MIKLRQLRERRIRRERVETKNVIDAKTAFRTPQEKVLEILQDIQERIDDSDKSHKQLDYCLKMIADNALYEMDDSEESDEDDAAS